MRALSDEMNMPVTSNRFVSIGNSCAVRPTVDSRIGGQTQRCLEQSLQ